MSRDIEFSIVSAVSRSNQLAVGNVTIGGIPGALLIDTGAVVNLISKETYQNIRKHHSERSYALQEPQYQLSGVSGTTVDVLGVVRLPVHFRGSSSFAASFYVVSKFHPMASGLLGLSTMAERKIEVYPGEGLIVHENVPYMCMATPQPKHSDKEVKTVGYVRGFEEKSNQRVMKQDRLCDTARVEVTRWTVVTAIVPDAHRLQPQEMIQFKVCLKGVKEGVDVVCMSETCKLKGVSLESTLTTVKSGGETVVLAVNNTGVEIEVKPGSQVCDFLVYHGTVLEPKHNLPVVSVVGCIDASPSSELRSQVKTGGNSEGKEELLQLLQGYRKAIALAGEPLGSTDLTSHVIKLKREAQPSYIKSYRLPHSQRQIVDDTVKDMLKQKVIEPSTSPWSSPIFLVPKKDGTYRPVIDYRRVNQQTVPDKYPMPHLNDLLQAIGEGNKVFSTLDLLSGYWQVPVHERSRDITAFSTHQGHYQFRRMPFGLCNAPTTFQRLVNNVLAGLIGKDALVYLDDIIIFSKDVPTHLEKLRKVLERLASAGLKLKLSKCEFLKQKIKYLGHEVDESGIHVNQDKIKAILKFPTPTKADHVRSFLGLAGYYRSFVYQFSSKAAPLIKLLKQTNKFEWGQPQEEAFSILKEALTQPPVLAFPDFKKPFILHTDASGVGLGAVLAQEDEGGKLKPIGYASKALNDTEKKYSVTHQEAYAIVWALKHFRPIIFGYSITVCTDHRPCLELFKGKNMTGKLARWHLTILEFNPTFNFVPGKINVVADALSRQTVNSVTTLSTISPQKLKTKQREDPMWKRVIYGLESGEEVEVPGLPLRTTEFILRDNVLHKVTVVEGKETYRIVVPGSLIETVLRLLHDAPQAGHKGRDACLEEARSRYFWLKMRKDIENHIKKCVSCARNKGTTGPPAPLQTFPSPAKPWDVVAIDVLQLPTSYQGSKYLLTCVDHFSRFVVLAPLQDKSAQSIAHALVNSLFCTYTIPRVLLSDNGTEFRNSVLEEICKLYNIKQVFTVAYHPQSNGMVERVNRKILEVLRHLAGSIQAGWEDWLCQVTACINSSIHSSLGKTPHYIIYGEDKVLPYDILVGRPGPVYNVDDYVSVQGHVFATIHHEVRKHMEASRAEHIARQHKFAKKVEIEEGDVVMVKTPERQSKLSPKFKGPYIVKRVLGNKLIVQDNMTDADLQTIMRTWGVFCVMLVAAFVSSKGSTDQIKPGALVGTDGRLEVVTDVITVRLNLGTLLDLKTRVDDFQLKFHNAIEMSSVKLATSDDVEDLGRRLEILNKVIVEQNRVIDSTFSLAANVAEEVNGVIEKTNEVIKELDRDAVVLAWPSNVSVADHVHDT
ncbi:hypothetical protein Pcinc_006591 [Petrolisthes cinctipes]|uniref:RNA-directed DNA polymerase n=1 Tax=Petrolisthes cinctipes TaxID=88211 RepID=A0AAE1GCQ5_PETCI|nr:hypothetical protein Pcinc_006591 [Petrolisthes cinctipes]